ncbi:MAG: TRAP transporter substrate-binding protein DctP [Elioraea tepidiphila]
MSSPLGRRAVLASAAALSAASALPASAQARRRIRFTAVFSDQDIRAEAMRGFQRDLADQFDVELHLNATLFRQGTELVAIQRGNVEMANLSPQDISRQIPAWSVMASAYLFRDADHLRKVFNADVGREFTRMAREQLNVHILGPLYFGTRHVNLRPRTRISTPADMRGIRLRMPPGDTWQFLGEALGANPTQTAITETYNALQTGVVDMMDFTKSGYAQLKLYEVAPHFTVTNHIWALGVMYFGEQFWQSITQPERDAIMQAAAVSCPHFIAMANEDHDRALAEARQHGAQIVEPDPAPWRAAMRPFWESFAPRVGGMERLMDIVNHP